MDTFIRISGRVLLLSSSADVMRRQLAGERVALQDALPLRDDISTDEITPAAVCLTYDERLGSFAYVGFDSGGNVSWERTPFGVATSK